MKRNMIQKNLIKNSIAAYYAAIELHNKPNIKYRYETVVILLINSWELLLKAFVRKHIKTKSIFKKDKGKYINETLPLKTILSYCISYLNKIEPNNLFRVTSLNIQRILEYRDNAVHFYNDKIDPIIFSLVAKNSYDYIKFVDKYFKLNIVDNEKIYIMPLGFKLPFNPETYFTKQYIGSTNSLKCEEFINSIISDITDLKSKSIEESILVGFEVKVDSIRDVKNSDFVMAISDNATQKIKILKESKIIISNSPEAKPIFFSPDDFYKIYKLTYKEVQEMCKKRYKDFTLNREYNGILADLKSKPKYSGTLGKSPKSKSKSEPQYMYTEYIFEELDKYYQKL